MTEDHLSSHPTPLVARLRRKVQRYPAQGGGSLGDGRGTGYITDDGYRLVNPDGPEAASTITDLEARLAAREAAYEHLAAEFKDTRALLANHDLIPTGEHAKALARLAAMREALEPFASFADPFVGDDGWTGPMKVERIIDWFGPSDFRRAAAALKDEPHAAE